VSEWTSPEDIADRARKRWSSGALLAAYGRGEPFPVVDVPLRGPRAGDVGEDFERVRGWAARLDRSAAGRYDLTRRTIGGRSIGRNEVPARALVSTYEQAWRLLDVEAQVASFERVLALCDGPARDWVLLRPLRAIAVADEWPALLAARDWLTGARGRYLREVSAPGVDTKLVERHRTTLATLLGVPTGEAEFLRALGLRDKPSRVRVRCDAGLAGLDRRVTEVTWRLDELAALRVSLQRVIVVENEVTFLCAPVPFEGLVVFGEGFRAARLGRLPWLEGVPVDYWGDLDTHGFAILDGLRAALPQTRSFLMDEETLLAHRDRWGTEPAPTRAALPRLDERERAVYEGLVGDRWGTRVRLEQERVDWAWATDRWPTD
jgi:hypothetical protein